MANELKAGKLLVIWVLITNLLVLFRDHEER